MIYLASPYYHENDVIRSARYALAQQAAAKLMAEGNVVFSPIAHSHGIAQYLPEAMAHSHKFWMKQDISILAFAECLYVLELLGVRESKGVSEEIAFAKKNRISIEFIEPATLLGNTNPYLIQHNRLFKSAGHLDNREHV